MRDLRDDPATLAAFERLASELEAGGGDPESFFAAHRALEPELRELYRGWQRVDGLLRELVGGSSLVQLALEAIGEQDSEERCRAALARIAGARDFAGRYELGSELGRGGMGVVWRARDRLLGRELALKVVRERPGGERTRARLLRRFLGEAQLTGRLQHPAIVAIHDLGLDAEGRVYFTMPLVEGRTLERVMELARARREGWTLPRLLEVLLRVCDAIGFAHAKGVLHRDLKPANVLVGEYGEVYVLDWGLARSVGALDVGMDANPDPGAGPAAAPSQTLEGEVLGTPAYMALEQALGSPVDERADVYALGALLYECLAGRRPYAAASGERSPEETLALLRAGPPEDVSLLAPSAPPELVAVVRKAMARTPARRYASVPALAAELRAYLEGRVVDAHERGALAELRKWLGRNRGLATASGLALLALGAGAFFQQRSAANAREALRQADIVARQQLLDELAAIRHPETAVEVSIVFPAADAASTESTPKVPASVRADYANYVARLDAHGAGDVAALARLLDGAPPEERAALLDELYWFELRLVPVTLGRTHADARRAEGQLAALNELVLRFETRPWRLALRNAWQRRMAGDAQAFDELVADERVRHAAAEELEWLSVLLSSLGDDARLRPVLVRVLELDPSSFWGHFRLATLSSGEERLVHAYAATALQPDSMQAWYNAGWNHQNISGPPFGDPSRAVPYYERALELEPGCWQAAINLSYLVSPEEGVALMERTIAAAPAAVLYHRLAERWRTLSKCERAVEAARAGLAQFPEHAELWAILGECNGWLGRWEEALAATLEADRRWPDQAVLQEHLGLFYSNLERHEEAVPHLVRSLELGNQNARVLLREVGDALATRPELADLKAEIEALLGP